MKKMLIFLSAMLLVLAGPAFAGNSLKDGQKLNAGERITSYNEDYYLQMQNDGNLVLYKASNIEPLWATDTAGNSGARAVMQSDGNLVVYSSSNGVLWAANTTFNYHARLVVQNDGNLVIYTEDGDPIWESDTVQETCSTEYVDHWGGTVVDGETVTYGVDCSVYAELLPEPVYFGPVTLPNGAEDVCKVYPPYAGKFPVQVCDKP